jgi:glycosyltransferase involved in cell wall biosynthesis
VPYETNIYINGKFLCQQATGVQKYALGLSLAMQRKHPGLVVLAPKGCYEPRGLNVKKIGWGQGMCWEQFCLPLFLLFRPNSLLLNFCNVAPLLRKKQIVCVHDLAFLKNRDWFRPAFRRWYRFLIPRLCKRALAILTVSEFSKEEISRTFSVRPEKITVVPNGAPDMAFSEQRPYPFQYLLLTGVNNPRKNASFILKVFPEIKKRNIQLVCLGNEGKVFGTNSLEASEGLHFLNYVDDKHYYTLLKHAQALLFPSTYEGFGIPVLEALLLGTPVVAPEIPVYRESFGALPNYYPAEDVTAFLKGIDEINIHKSNINDLQYLKNNFNFDKSAEILSEVLNDCLTQFNK